MAERQIDVVSNSPRPWNDPKVRAVAFQVLAAALVAWLIYTLFQNTLTNMHQRNIQTGFGFLSQRAGFGIVFSLIPYDSTMTYGRTFVVGLLNTLLVSGLGIVLASILGFVVGIARLSRNWLVAKLAAVFIEVFRNIPLLLQIFFWYFAVLGAVPPARQSLSLGKLFFLNNRGLFLPGPIFKPGMGVVWAAAVLAIVAVIVLKRWAHQRQERTGKQFHTFWTGLAILLVLPVAAFLLMGRPLAWSIPRLQGFNFAGGLSIMPELAALVVALTIYTSAFIAEIVRSGILSVSHGQTEAASALGLSHGLTIRLVVIPQAMRVIIPPLTSQFLNLTKNSSLATAIGFPDLVSVFMGTTLNQTGQAVEIVAMTMGVYLSISLAISLFMNLYNRSVALKER